MQIGSSPRKHLQLATLGLVLGVLATACAAPSTVANRLDTRAKNVRALDVPAGYYDAAKDKTGRDLLVTLGQIIGNQRDLGYDTARDVMFGTIDDPQGLDTVECVYTGRRLSGVTDRKTAFRNGQGLDTEHTWPQSMGAKFGPAKADLHHLFPSDIRANSSRGNAPFGEVMSTFLLLPEDPILQDQSRSGNDDEGRPVFEPRTVHKGNVARALLYFYTRYGLKPSAGINLRNFAVEKAVLKQWNALDPVDDAERLRNEAIYQAQGNRNPYVDHPEYVEQIGSLD